MAVTLKTIFHSLFLLTLVSTAFGQHRVGIRVGAGLSRISNSFEYPNASIKIYQAPSGLGGLYYNFQFNEKSSMSTELLLAQIEGREIIKWKFYDSNGNSTGNSTSHIYKHITYLALPVSYGFSIKKTTVNVGFQAAVALRKEGRVKIDQVNNGDASSSDGKLKLDIDRYDFGPRVGVGYALSEKLSAEGIFYYGINNLLSDDNVLSFSWKIRQLSFGVRYSLWSTGN